MLIAIAAHFVVAMLLPLAARALGRWVFAAGAVVPAVTLVLALTRLGGALDGTLPAETLAWAPGVGLELTLRMDALAMLMIILVSGVGALVLAYYAAYAKPGDVTSGRNAVLLVVFAGSMLGLVLADDIFSLYIFWELTTVCSFLLVGGDGASKKARRSALQALLVTSLGGLAMLLGLILLATAAGTSRISEILAAAPSGTVVNVAVVLVLIGAFTKSAQVPFHPWLPAAMVAPTPVSAYLHAAAMVKAGVYLVARFAPGFSELPAWWVPLVVLGLWTMVLGGFRALREHDLKTLLAFGTVSQLGFLMVLVGTGGYVAAIAGATMVLAHGLFKSSLFLTVGLIDKRAGTRDIRELSGLGRRWPWLTATVTLAVASMAGVPPLLGFVGKEAALEAFADGSVRGVLVLAGIVIGSMLTVAYSLRFLLGAFGSRPGAEPTPLTAPGAGLVAPLALPALAGLVLAFATGLVEPLAAGYARAYPDTGYHLALWHGVSLPLLLSIVVFAGGYLIHRGAAFVPRISGWVPEPMHAQRGYRGVVATLDGFAHGVTARLQAGSLPTYIGVILVTMVLVPGAGLFAGLAWPGELRLWDSWLQLPLAVLALVAAATVVLARRRLTAVLLTGVVGYGIGALFLVDGGSDLALAQFLVESLTLVVFVFVLRRFPPHFVHGKPPVARRRWVKAGVASAGGIFVAVMAVVFSGSRSGLPEASTGYIAGAEENAGATNVVNAIIVDFRAFDTVGEISVLAVAATGAASLILAAHRARRRPIPEASADEAEHRDGATEVDR
ncbi:NADH ubiquinone oxidoreductase subunit NDUFA12 [Amycolatopsis antarctica]|uniref:NADH ubiquinone oxidoreductase subunit NDUFA12 n=1 Tax=Amycolatopsis antarctica TaxID=1854586 RepID=A0A263CXL9_9PSEU|nr:hydrogen gas-evolving membrane-bound hydrogenase subunit E [Amycolatopsis antarctica]OZM70851.1 NADH ubiquinone oxidoreductase subunit NDUFA12 [Amycolatopsis antarctica]